jgi:uncharacterized protein (TIGR02145 family)
MRHFSFVLAFLLLACFSSGLLAQPHEGKKGDANNDGAVNVLDMLTIANHILGIVILDEQGLWRADLNGPPGDCDGDGSANVLDMVKIANIILGNDECPTTSCPTVTDIDGNTYQTIQIGNQCWMAENLKVTHYRNGDTIPNITDNSEWSRLSTGAFCSYDNNADNAVTYGRMYNWYAVSDSRNIAPEGWHVPTDAEWETLVNHLDGSSVAGGKMKATGTIEEGTGLWYSPNEGATNSSGFSALPGGYRDDANGSFGSLGEYAYFWSSTDYGGGNAWGRPLSYMYIDTHGNDYGKRGGISVRCVKN